MWEYATETFDSLLDTKNSLKKKSNECLKSMGKKAGNL